MGYEVKVVGKENRGLAVWLTAMSGLTVSVSTHGSDLFMGVIDRLSSDRETIYLTPIDLHGRALPDLPVQQVAVDDIARVAVW
jgi:hypothetical protein